MNKSLFAVVFLSGGAIGAFAGYKLALRGLRGEFEEALEVETSAIAARYAARQKYASPQDAVDALSMPAEVTEIIEEYQGKKEPVAYHKITPSKVQAAEKAEVVKPEPVVEENIFDKPIELGPIYVIPQLEYEVGGGDNQKVNLTWYVEDSVLADFDDQIYQVPADLIGDALDRFGEGNDDPEVVYIRNTKIDIDYELVRDPGSYWRSRHGMEPAEAPPSGRNGE